ncbi:hypothetical protein G6030_09325, partial [Dietzia sp. E1]|nr:hypothetical protein [Dietzia sp. E1]
WDAVGLSSPAVVRQASGIAAAHLQWHLERDLRSLPLVDRGLIGADADGVVAARPDSARPDSARPAGRPDTAGPDAARPASARPASARPADAAWPADSAPVIPVEEPRARTTQIP